MHLIITFDARFWRANSSFLFQLKVILFLSFHFNSIPFLLWSRAKMGVASPFLSSFAFMSSFCLRLPVLCVGLPIDEVQLQLPLVKCLKQVLPCFFIKVIIFRFRFMLIFKWPSKDSVGKILIPIFSSLRISSGCHKLFRWFYAFVISPILCFRSIISSPKVDKNPIQV